MSALARALSDLLRAAVRVYQVALSPLSGPSCRYIPTCSCYADEALERWGPVRGLLLTAYRILRCHPFARGGLDPVPSRPASTDPSTPASPLAPRTSDFGPESSQPLQKLVGESGR